MAGTLHYFQVSGGDQSMHVTRVSRDELAQVFADNGYSPEYTEHRIGHIEENPNQSIIVGDNMVYAVREMV